MDKWIWFLVFIYFTSVAWCFIGYFINKNRMNIRLVKDDIIDTSDCLPLLSMSGTEVIVLIVASITPICNTLVALSADVSFEKRYLKLKEELLNMDK